MEGGEPRRPARSYRVDRGKTLPVSAPKSMQSLPERAPEVGELVQVRSRRWLVEEVVPSATPAQSVLELGHPMSKGEGIDDDGAWPPERSILVLGIERQTAVELGRRFGQRAIVCGELSGVADLALCE